MSANKLFAYIFAFVLFFLTISTVALAFLEGDFSNLSSKIWEEEFFAKARAWCDKIVGIEESNGVYISDNTLIKITEEPNEIVTQENIETINRLAQAENNSVFTLIVPTANVILQKKLPDNAMIWDQSRYIDDVYARLSSGVIRCYDTLFANNAEDIYYRTSNNITPLGGYYLYRALSQRLGFYPNDRNHYNIEYFNTNYFGDLFTMTGYRDVQADPISFYRGSFSLQDVQTTVYDAQGRRAVYNDIYFKETKDHSYSFPGSFPLTVITNKAAEGKNLLVVADQTAESMVNFLVDHYQTVTIVNPFLQCDATLTVSDFQNYDQVLILLNVETFGSQSLTCLDKWF